VNLGIGLVELGIDNGLDAGRADITATRPAR
jgi:hypothetical protein